MDIGDWAAVWAVGFGGLTVLSYFLSRGRSKDHLRAAADWARARGFGFREGAGNRGWVYELRRGANAGVRFQADGVVGGYPFTLAYVDHSYGDADSGGRVELTVVVLHLRNAYAATEVEQRRGRRKDAVGHAGFDRRFRVRTEVAAGPGVVVSPALADAMVAGDLPTWSVRERELVCFVEGRQEAVLFDRDLERAVRVAGLLGVR
ncbi:hypothetical protein ACQPZF_13070 [Actinosynnema sp. CS-041913]|uniref:hypothetical protein n=1 Tax=Actinosynnema sp. CS-041913 TaxID=3239917 RepID=UPI003D9438B5